MSRPQRLFLAYDQGALAGNEAARDVLTQMEAIEKALAGQAILTERLGVDLDFSRLKSELAAANQPAVFNLVESLDGCDKLQSLFTLALESWNIPFTGSGSAALIISNDKILSKRLLQAAGLPCPACCFLEADGTANFTAAAVDFDRPWIIKPSGSHASIGMDDASVRRFSGKNELAAWLRRKKEEHGQDFFAEVFIGGREFNLSLVEDEGKIIVLPPAEIVFASYPPDKPKIVGYAAKWREDSFEYKNTVRSFAALDSAGALAKQLSDAALAAWQVFGLGGYARIDFRVDSQGQSYILEANANPCLSPDAGFAAAAAQHGWSYRDLCLKLTATLTK